MIGLLLIGSVYHLGYHVIDETENLEDVNKFNYSHTHITFKNGNKNKD